MKLKTDSNYHIFLDDNSIILMGCKHWIKSNFSAKFFIRTNEWNSNDANFEYLNLTWNFRLYFLLSSQILFCLWPQNKSIQIKTSKKRKNNLLCAGFFKCMRGNKKVDKTRQRERNKRIWSLKSWHYLNI